MAEKLKPTLVYSTEKGRVVVKSEEKKIRKISDGIVCIQRQVSGRRGKGVTVIMGLDLPDLELANIASIIKKHCGCGGSVKNGTIEIQGDKREIVKSWFIDQGYNAKLTGG